MKTFGDYTVKVHREPDPVTGATKAVGSRIEGPLGTFRVPHWPSRIRGIEESGRTLLVNCGEHDRKLLDADHDSLLESDVRAGEAYDKAAGVGQLSERELGQLRYLVHSFSGTREDRTRALAEAGMPDHVATRLAKWLSDQSRALPHWSDALREDAPPPDPTLLERARQAAPARLCYGVPQLPAGTLDRLTESASWDNQGEGRYVLPDATEVVRKPMQDAFAAVLERDADVNARGLIATDARLREAVRWNRDCGPLVSRWLALHGDARALAESDPKLVAIVADRAVSGVGPARARSRLEERVIEAQLIGTVVLPMPAQRPGALSGDTRPGEGRAPAPIEAQFGAEDAVRGHELEEAEARVRPGDVAACGHKIREGRRTCPHCGEDYRMAEAPWHQPEQVVRALAVGPWQGTFERASKQLGYMVEGSVEAGAEVKLVRSGSPDIVVAFSRGEHPVVEEARLVEGTVDGEVGVTNPTIMAKAPLGDEEEDVPDADPEEMEAGTQEALFSPKAPKASISLEPHPDHVDVMHSNPAYNVYHTVAGQRQHIGVVRGGVRTGQFAGTARAARSGSYTSKRWISQPQYGYSLPDGANHGTRRAAVQHLLVHRGLNPKLFQEAELQEANRIRHHRRLGRVEVVRACKANPRMAHVHKTGIRRIHHVPFRELHREPLREADFTEAKRRTCPECGMHPDDPMAKNCPRCGATMEPTDEAKRRLRHMRRQVPGLMFDNNVRGNEYYERPRPRSDRLRSPIEDAPMEAAYDDELAECYVHVHRRDGRRFRRAFRSTAEAKAYARRARVRGHRARVREASIEEAGFFRSRFGSRPMVKPVYTMASGHPDHWLAYSQHPHPGSTPIDTVEGPAHVSVHPTEQSANRVAGLRRPAWRGGNPVEAATIDVAQIVDDVVTESATRRRRHRAARMMGRRATRRAGRHVSPDKKADFYKAYGTVRGKYPIPPPGHPHARSFAKAALRRINQSDLSDAEKARVRGKARAVLAKAR